MQAIKVQKYILFVHFQEGEVEAVAIVHSYEDDVQPGSQQTRLNALNVPPMGLSALCFWFQSPDVYPPAPHSQFSDYEDMLEETWDFPRRTDVSDGYFPGSRGYFPMWENYPTFQKKPKKEDDIGLLQREFFQQLDFNFIYSHVLYI